MKIKITIVAALMGLSSGAFAKGGVIGGGEVSFKTIMTCDAAGIDPTHAAVPYVHVLQEINYDGTPVRGVELKVVTLNHSLSPLNYYNTNKTDFDFTAGTNLNMKIQRWAIDASQNEVIGSFKWDANVNRGALVVNDGQAPTEELELTNCITIR